MDNSNLRAAIAGAGNNWLTTKRAAFYLDLQPCTLEKWRSAGKGPKFHKIGNKAVRYRISDLNAFIDGGKND